MDSLSGSGNGPGDRAPLTVDLSADGTTAVVALTGELDISNVSVLTAKLEEALQASPEVLVFDMSKLRFLDSSGIGTILRVSTRVGAVRLRRPSDIVGQVIRHMGLAEVLSIEA